jgi:hypothetical protein
MQFPRKLLIVSILLWVITALIFIADLYPFFVLTYYSSGLYPILSSCLRWISSLFPFAIGDIIYVLLIIFGIRKIFLLFKQRKSFKRADRFIIPIKGLNVLLVLYISFNVLWGLNYARPSISSQLAISNDKYTVQELLQLSNFFIDRLNALQVKTDARQNYTLEEMRNKAVLVYQKMQLTNTFFRYQNASFKPAISSWLISKTGIEGYYNPVSGEANLNTLLPAWVLPFVACHEISHQLGVAREDEANLVGYLTAVNSDDVNFQYSANYHMLRYLLAEVRVKSPESYEALYKRIAPAIIANFKAESEFWRAYDSQMSSYMSIAFDKFLKFNKQQRGIDSYQDIVIWLWNLHKVDIKKSAS